MIDRVCGKNTAYVNRNRTDTIWTELAKNEKTIQQKRYNYAMSDRQTAEPKVHISSRQWLSWVAFKTLHVVTLPVNLGHKTKAGHAL